MNLKYEYPFFLLVVKIITHSVAEEAFNDAVLTPLLVIEDIWGAYFGKHFTGGHSYYDNKASFPFALFQVSYLDPSKEREIWTSDGTALQTRCVK
jgi:hypothetical protein